MKTNLVLTAIGALTLAACGGTSQNPLKNYPQSAQLQPRDPTIQQQKLPVEYVDREKPVEVPKYIVQEKEKKIPDYQYVPVGTVNFFAVIAPEQLQFVVGTPASIPVRIKGLVGQLKYEIAVESETLRNLKLENIKVEGNDTTANLIFTASSSDIQAGQMIGTGGVNFKLKILEVKDANPSLEKLYRQEVATSSTRVLRNPYIIVPAGTAVKPATGVESAKPQSEMPATGDAK